MNKILRNSWALFTGMGFIMLAHGYQGSLLGVRAVQEEFTLVATGFMLSGYYVGYFIGAKTIPTFILRVGHIRVFAAFASLASIAVLFHSIFVHPFTCEEKGHITVSFLKENQEETCTFKYQFHDNYCLVYSTCHL